MTEFKIIAAIDECGGIGKNGTMAWYDREDLQRFKTITQSHIVIMGYKTFLSLSKPLPNRVNIVLTSSHLQNNSIPLQSSEELYFLSSLEEAFSKCEEIRTNHPKYQNAQIFVIGGSTIYRQALGKYGGLCQSQLITLIPGNNGCDVFYPLDLVDVCFSKYNELPVYFGEKDYLRLLKKCLTRPSRDNRTGIKTRSLFGESMKFDLQTSFPLLTTKKVIWSSIVDELLFFIRGDTNISTMKTKIWKGNTSRSFLDNRGLNLYPEGEMGPMYPFQWRHAGANIDCTGQRLEQGFDQLSDLIDTLIKDPFSRRLLLCNWDASNIHKMVLAPCHVLYQLYVTDGYLDAIMYQRSADIFLGVPFNIASYALLTCIIAKLANLQPRNLTIYFGDLHIYETHLKAAQLQLFRKPFPLPSLKIKDIENIDAVTEDSIILENYQCWPGIKAEMAI